MRQRIQPCRCASFQIQRDMAVNVQRAADVAMSKLGLHRLG
jgi:hypothetical protein